ncbi:MAG: CusA/CzcA family heavy metal efflux RND transporter [Candidatus Cyclobacteriaceae bacterium M3_2C_046]
MINSLISFSIKNKLIIFLATFTMVAFGIYSTTQIPIGAVPDITNNQVQVITTSRNLSTLDVEQFITYPVELEMANLPGVKEIRSVSKFGLSVVTIVFEDDLGTYLPRQLIAEKIKSAQEKIPQGFGTPEMGPITTGLGEIYQYTVETRQGYEEQYSIQEIRTIQDWMIKRQLSGIPGVVEINTWGGYLKQYEVSVNPERLKSYQITLGEVYQALASNNDNTGGSYIEKSAESYFVRGEGMVTSLDDIRKIVVKTRNGLPVLVEDIGEVKYGDAVRFGAITGNGTGEKVMGQIMMLKGANSAKVIEAVKARMAEVEATLPEGLFINDFLERTELIHKTTSTITENLVLGALIVIFVLVILMGNLRSGLIVASVIPLSLLFGLSLMYVFGVDVNLMSLGAIDFGILVDGAVIIVEFIVFQVTKKQAELKLLKGQDLQQEKDNIAIDSSSRMMRSAIFGQIIILIVFIPILSLTNVEGKMFRPMALSFIFILIGAMILCLTYVPAISAMFIKPPKKGKVTLADRIMNFLHKFYDPTIRYALSHRKLVIFTSILLLGATVFTFIRMGGEFIPTLDEGDYVIQPVLKPGTSLSETIRINTSIENILLENFPEVEQVVTRIGAAEVPTDPMSMEMSDIIVILKDKDEWVSADSKELLADEMKEKLSVIPGIGYEFTQPIEMRFNELITGVRADVAVKIYGEDLDLLYEKGNEIKNLINRVEGASDVNVEQIVGLPQVSVVYNRQKLAKYGLKINDLNDMIRMSFAGKTAGSVFEGEKRFDMVVRLNEHYRNNLETISDLYLDLPGGGQIPLREVADITFKTGPAQISRDNTRRRIVVSINVRNRDVESLVQEIQDIVNKNISLPDGYYVTYGGQFENLQHAKKRLMVAVPVALLLIFVLLHFTFNSIKQAALVYSAIPLAAIGGVFFLWIRGMPFSISAGVGFIALFGIAVLNGIILISFFNELKYEEGIKDIRQRVLTGTKMRLRPVILTAATDILGFFPMAFSTSAGAEVQRPLATVVIGGLFTATFLTLVVLPVIYYIFDEMEISWKPHFKVSRAAGGILLIFALLLPAWSWGQEKKTINLSDAIQLAFENNAQLQASELQIEKNQKLQKTAFDPGSTMLYLGTEENSYDMENDGIDSYGLQQSIQFPTVYTAQSKVLKTSTRMSRYNFQMDQRTIEKNVSQAYYQLLYHQQRYQILTYLDSLFLRFYQAASRRYELGESDYLEKLSAQSQYNQININQKQAAADIASTYDVLASYLQIKQEFEIKADSLEKVNLSEDNLNLKDHPRIKYFTALSDMAQAKLNLERNKLLPGIYFQYFLQNVNNQTGFFGYQAGLNIPLWFIPQSARIQSAKIQNEITGYQAQNYLVNLEAGYDQLVSQLNKYEVALQYFSEQGIQMARELEQVSGRQYQEGESGYLQYIQSLQQAARIRLSYLDNLNQYNQTAFELKYIQ